jgi:preprotein translocase subunit SecY
MLVIFRFIANVPIPGADLQALERAFQDNDLLGFLNLFSGGALQNLSIASMGVYPYITAQIIMQLMVPVIPRLTELSKEGEYGRQRVQQYTHILTIPLSIGQGYGQLVLLERAGAITGIGLAGNELLPTIAMLAALTTGTMFLVWMGELITEKGIGNGISIIIFGGIVSSLPRMVQQYFSTSGINASLIILLVLAVGIVYSIVVFTEAQRRIPVQYGRSLFRGGRMYRQTSASFIPIRVNSAGMIPLIFAFSILILPPTVASYFVDPASTGLVSRVAAGIANTLSPTGLTYWVLVFILVVVFTFFYTLVVFNQQNLAENLQRNGGFIPGIRPGRPTHDYLFRVLLRITWGGALFLGVVAVIPFVAGKVTNLQAASSIISSTSLLIMVGVALDTMRQLEAQLLMRNYEGFLR